MTARIAVLASGNGSNLQAIVDACASGQLNATVVGVASDQPEAFALERATQHHIASAVVQPLADEPRSEYDARLAAAVRPWQPTVVVLAGFMRKLTQTFIAQFPNCVINIHPALPQQLPGIRAIERAFAQFQAGTRTSSGVMVHFVPNEGVDSGPVIDEVSVAFLEHDTLESFAARMHETEHALIVKSLHTIISKSQKATAP
jgi:phosphoribosylglycinamide formyltransferase-1